MAKPMTQVQRNARLKKANREKGLVQSQVWLPKYRLADLKRIVSEWRDEHDRANGG